MVVAEPYVHTGEDPFGTKPESGNKYIGEKIRVVAEPLGSFEGTIVDVNQPEGGEIAGLTWEIFLNDSGLTFRGEAVVWDLQVNQGDLPVYEVSDTVVNRMHFKLGEAKLHRANKASEEKVRRLNEITSNPIYGTW